MHPGFLRGIYVVSIWQVMTRRRPVRFHLISLVSINCPNIVNVVEACRGFDARTPTWTIVVLSKTSKSIFRGQIDANVPFKWCRFTPTGCRICRICSHGIACFANGRICSSISVPQVGGSIVERFKESTNMSPICASGYRHVCPDILNSSECGCALAIVDIIKSCWLLDDTLVCSLIALWWPLNGSCTKLVVNVRICVDGKYILDKSCQFIWRSSICTPCGRLLLPLLLPLVQLHTNNILDGIPRDHVVQRELSIKVEISIAELSEFEAIFEVGNPCLRPGCNPWPHAGVRIG